MAVVADLTRNWWVFLLRGIAAMLFGILALINPAITLIVLVILFAAYALVDGVLSIIVSLTAGRGYRGWGWLLASGILSVIIGAMTYLWPNVTAVVLLYWIMAWLLVTGIALIVAGIRLRREISGEFLVIVTGALTAIVALYLMVNPQVGALAVVGMIAGYAIVFGVMMLIIAFRLRSMRGSNVRMAPAL